MGFVWNDFGVLAKHDEDDECLYAVNTDGDRKQMSKKSYRDWDKIRAKLIEFEGKKCSLRTSQNTNDWDKEIWFSDVKVVE